MKRENKVGSVNLENTFLQLSIQKHIAPQNPKLKQFDREAVHYITTMAATTLSTARGSLGRIFGSLPGRLLTRNYATAVEIKNKPFRVADYIKPDEELPLKPKPGRIKPKVNRSGSLLRGYTDNYSLPSIYQQPPSANVSKSSRRSVHLHQ